MLIWPKSINTWQKLDPNLLIKIKKYKENKTHQINKNFKNENKVFPPIQVFIFDFLLF
jgi:hypothetical protein